MNKKSNLPRDEKRLLKHYRQLSPQDRRAIERFAHALSWQSRKT